MTASDLLTAAAGRIEKELSGEPGVAAELGFLVAQSFDNLGEDAKEEPVLRAAVARAEATFGRSHLLTLQAKAQLADVLVLHDVPGSLALSEELIPETMRGLPATAEVAILVLRDKSFALAKLNRAEDSYGALKEAVQLAGRYFGNLDEHTISALELLANTYARFGAVQNELVTATDAVERARRAFGAQRPHNTLLSCERTYADALRDNNRPGDAVAILRDVVADQRKLDAADTLRVRNAKYRLGIALQLTGRLEEAIPLLREEVRLEREQNPAESDDRLSFAESLANVLFGAQLIDEWKTQEDRVTELRGRLGPQPHRVELYRLMRRASLATLLGKSARRWLWRTRGPRRRPRTRSVSESRRPRSAHAMRASSSVFVRAWSGSSARSTTTRSRRSPSGSRLTCRVSWERSGWSSGIYPEPNGSSRTVARS